MEPRPLVRQNGLQAQQAVTLLTSYAFLVTGFVTIELPYMAI